MRNLLLGFVVCLLVVSVSATECWYGRYDYGDDSVGYLDISKAIDRGDWTVALNPYWSIGYPLILSATRWTFPPGPQNEWTALHVLNLVLFLLIWVSFLYFLRVATIYTAWPNGRAEAPPDKGWNGFILCMGTSIFLLWQLLAANASRLSPDAIVSGAFFLVLAAGLNFLMRPSVKAAAIMGLLMGAGYVLKAIFMPISAIVFLTMVLASFIRAGGNRLPVLYKLSWALPAMALLVLPYATALSKATRLITYGETGRINYAWCVNNLPRSTDWQGGPAEFGTPMHPTHMISVNPPAFAFGEPFPVTYPPWFNPPYWYEGYRSFFSLGNQVAAVRSNLTLYRRFFIEGDYSTAKTIFLGLAVMTGLYLLRGRRTWLKRMASLWPLYLPAFAAIGLYLLVFVELRYVMGFFILLAVLPFVCLFSPTPLISKKSGCIVTVLIALYCAALLAQDKHATLLRAIHNQPYTSEEQWQVGLYLAQSGLVHPGEKTAVVGIGNRMNCTYAYVSGIHIAAEIGNDGYDFDHQEKDLRLFTDHPDVQQAIFKLFQQEGIEMVAVCYVLDEPQGPGWEGVPGTGWWIHRMPAGNPN
jgi:hypothetical protein